MFEHDVNLCDGVGPTPADRVWKQYRFDVYAGTNGSMAAGAELIQVIDQAIAQIQPEPIELTAVAHWLYALYGEKS